MSGQAGTALFFLVRLVPAIFTTAATAYNRKRRVEPCMLTLTLVMWVNMETPLVKAFGPKPTNSDQMTLQTPKTTKSDKTHKVHVPKFQGRVFSEVGEAPQAC